MSSLAIVVLGFTAFGLVFLGMMCVLPGTVSHPADEHHAPQPVQTAAPVRNPAAAANAYTYKSA